MGAASFSDVLCEADKEALRQVASTGKLFLSAPQPNHR